MPTSLLDIHVLIFVALMAVFVAAGHGLASHSRFFGQLVDQKRGSESYECHLDGLRGLAAFAVFVHHAAYIWPDIENGGWFKPESHFMELLGAAGVSMFFFLSGYLFWRGFLRQDPKLFSVTRFYKQRLFRIAPVYWLFCLVMVLMVLWDSGGTLRTSLAEFVVALGQWLVFGVPVGRFPDVNGFPLTRLINGDVAWSLRHEVLFYLLLPLLLPMATRRQTWPLLAMFVTSFIFLSLLYAFLTRTTDVSQQSSATAWAMIFLKEGLLDFNKFLIMGFAPGMLAAHLLQHERYLALMGRIQPRHAQWVVLMCCLFLLLNTDPRFSFLKLVPLSVIFFLVVAKKVGTELLRARGLVVLGLISYSVYVFHGLFLFALQPQGWDIYKAIGIAGAPFYWLLMGVVGLAVLAVSAWLYRCVEAPCIEWGKRVTPSTSA